jgi:7-carboxy-7-deazaguanine synthase
MSQDKNIRIIETYLSVQGEGMHAGLPCFFIRTAVCDIRCSWCDTPQALGNGPSISFEELLARVPTSVRLIQITGGEPLVQKDQVITLCEALHARGKKILLETGGHRSLDGIPDYVHIVMDIKLPGSGQAHHPFEKNFEWLKKSDEIKFVIQDRIDFDAALSWIRSHNLENACHLLLSPVWGSVAPATLTQWLLEENIDARMQIQLHKIIWGANATGV